VLILEAANNDPLRAMEIEEKVTAEWWAYWQTFKKELAEASHELANKD